MAVAVSTCLWFDGRAREAAEFYVSLIPDSRIVSDSGMVVAFELAGTPYQILNGGPNFKLNEAASIVVTTEDQTETDRLWEALTTDGGAESRCGWLKDRWGVSWQIVPRRALELFSGPHAEAVFAALMDMTRIDIAALEAAAAG